MTEAAPEPDRLPGAPHPRETARLFGQEAAEAGFLEAFASGRLHHGWLITGPRGVGKATLAWRIARFLLSQPLDDPGGGLFGDALAPAIPATLDTDPEHPVARRIRAGSEPGLKLVRRGGAGTSDADRHKKLMEGKFSQDIRVSEIRELAQFIRMTASDGGRRVVIVDAADEMNIAAANALLKMLEEPPARTTLLLISHQPAGLLPTIRSRCRELRLSPLGPEDMAAALAQAGQDPGAETGPLAAIGGGSVGEAMRLLTLDGLPLYAEVVGLLASLPGLDRARALKLSEAVAARGATDRLDLLIHLVDVALSRLARTGATGRAPLPEAARGEAQAFARLAPSPAAGRRWAELAQETSARLAHGRAVNIDPAGLLLDAFLRLRDSA
jgi:DNA polymerase-3 subunit delta'